MANRLNGNVLIIDSAMGNQFVLGAQAGRNLDEFKIQTISFFRLSTLGTCIITQANTSTDVVFNSNVVVTGILTALTNAVLFENPKTVMFPLGFKTSDLKVPTLSAGTAYIYLA